jgi:hypothetical protein
MHFASLENHCVKRKKTSAGTFFRDWKCHYLIYVSRIDGQINIQFIINGIVQKLSTGEKEGLGVWTLFSFLKNPEPVNN